MGIPEDYDDDVERRRTHPLLMPKMESDKISLADGEVLEKVAIVTPVKPPAMKSKKKILRGKGVRSISPGVKTAAKQRSVLREDKYAPGGTSRCVFILLCKEKSWESRKITTTTSSAGALTPF